MDARQVGAPGIAVPPTRAEQPGQQEPAAGDAGLLAGQAFERADRLTLVAGFLRGLGQFPQYRGDGGMLAGKGGEPGQCGLGLAEAAQRLADQQFGGGQAPGPAQDRLGLRQGRIGAGVEQGGGVCQRRLDAVGCRYGGRVPHSPSYLCDCSKSYVGCRRASSQLVVKVSKSRRTAA